MVENNVREEKRALKISDGIVREQALALIKWRVSIQGVRNHMTNVHIPSQKRILSGSDNAEDVGGIEKHLKVVEQIYLSLSNVEEILDKNIEDRKTEAVELVLRIKELKLK